MTKSKKLGFWMCLALVMGNMIGSGVFLLPAALAPYGLNAVAAWIFTVSGVAMLAIVLARLTRALPEADGPLGFTQAAFGELPAFLIAYSYWIAVWVGNAAVATAAISYLSVFVPQLGQNPALSAAATLALVWGITLINVRGSTTAGTVQIITTMVKIVPLLLVLGLVFWVLARHGSQSLLPFPSKGLSPTAITGAAALTLWAMVGFESASVSAAGVERPETTIPRATLFGAGLTGLLYLIVCSGIALLLPTAIAAKSNAPFADFVAIYWGTGLSQMVALLACISAIGALNGLTLVQGMLPLSLARAGSFPRYFAATSANGTPVRALLGTSVLTSLMILMNSARSMGDMFTFMALVSTSATLYLYLMIAVVSLRLRVGGLVGILAVSYALWTLWGAGIAATGWGLVLMLSGVPVFWASRRGLNRVKISITSA